MNRCPAPAGPSHQAGPGPAGEAPGRLHRSERVLKTKLWRWPVRRRSQGSAPGRDQAHKCDQLAAETVRWRAGRLILAVSSCRPLLRWEHSRASCPRLMAACSVPHAAPLANVRNHRGLLHSLLQFMRPAKRVRPPSGLGAPSSSSHAKPLQCTHFEQKSRRDSPVISRLSGPYSDRARKTRG